MARSASLPAGASLVIYLSPNQGAINNNANGDEAGYIADVESNYGVINFPGGLSGSSPSTTRRTPRRSITTSTTAAMSRRTSTASATIP